MLSHLENLTFYSELERNQTHSTWPEIFQVDVISRMSYNDLDERRCTVYARGTIHYNDWCTYYIVCMNVLPNVDADTFEVVMRLKMSFITIILIWA